LVWIAAVNYMFGIEADSLLNSLLLSFAMPSHDAYTHTFLSIKYLHISPGSFYILLSISLDDKTSGELSLQVTSRCQHGPIDWMSVLTNCRECTDYVENSLTFTHTVREVGHGTTALACSFGILYLLYM